MTLTATTPQGDVATTLVTLSPATVGIVSGADALATNASTTLTVSIPGVAPVGGASVAVTSRDPRDLPVPATVTVPAGANSVSFPVTSLYAGTLTRYVDVTASYGGASAIVTVALSKTGAGG